MLKWHIENIEIKKNDTYPDLYDVYVNGIRQIIADFENILEFLTEITRSDQYDY